MILSDTRITVSSMVYLILRHVRWGFFNSKLRAKCPFQICSVHFALLVLKHKARVDDWNGLRTAAVDCLVHKFVAKTVVLLYDESSLTFLQQSLD